MLNRTYELDMVPGGIPLSIHLSQYDSDVTLNFQLFASQGTLDIPNSGVTAQIRGTKLDGNAGRILLRLHQQKQGLELHRGLCGQRDLRLVSTEKTRVSADD